jgi:ribosomal protein L19
MEKFKQEMNMNQFHASEFFTIRVLETKGSQEKLITIWSPSMDTDDILKEGNVVRVRILLLKELDL